MIDVKFKKLRDDVKLPVKATDGSAAYDLYTSEQVLIRPLSRTVVKLGFSMAMPYGVQAQVEPRSGYSCKGFQGYRVEPTADSIDKVITLFKKAASGDTTHLGGAERFNADVILGKIDSDYRGECGVIIHNNEGRHFVIKKHQRIAQLTFQKVEDVNFEEVEELDETSRDGGFGHSGSGEIK